MLDELEKYEDNDHFFLTSKKTIEEVCNAPSDKNGVYLIYALKDGRIELVYIGSSAGVNQAGSTVEGIGLVNSIINGGQVGGRMDNSFKAKMMKETIEALDIYWYVTHDDKFTDSPKSVQEELLKMFNNIYGRLPRWNSRV